MPSLSAWSVDIKQQTPYIRGMEVELTHDQEALVREAIKAGRLHGPEDAAKEAFCLWEARERRRAEILASVDFAEAAVARGEGQVVTEESMRELGHEVSQRGHARLAAEQWQAPR